MALRERLEQLIRSAPPGTLVPVEGLLALLDGEDQTESVDLTMDDVGRLAAERFGRRSPYKSPAVRRWIRSGLRGVHLRAYASGSGYRVTRANFERFLEAVRRQPTNRPPQEFPVTTGQDPDPEEELRAGATAYAATRR